MSDKKIKSLLGQLFGKELWTVRRAADLNSFHFGPRTRTRDFLGRHTEVGELTLHVQSAWRITSGDRIVLASRDLYFPADHNRDESIPEGFRWDRDPNRLDKLVTEFFSSERIVRVTEVDLGTVGSVRITLGKTGTLEVFPDDSLGGEYWRLFTSKENGPQLVVTGDPLVVTVERE